MNQPKSHIIGKAAYEAFKESLGWITKWSEVPARTQTAWVKAAQAAIKAGCVKGVKG